VIAISIRGVVLSQPRSIASLAIWTVIALRISAFKIHFRQLTNARQVPRNETAALRLNLGSIALVLRMPGTGWTP
jgi:hypothetical protein